MVGMTLTHASVYGVTNKWGQQLFLINFLYATYTKSGCGWRG